MFVQPEIVRRRLLNAALFIAAFEYVSDLLLDRVKGFYVSGFNDNGLTVPESYGTEVLGSDPKGKNDPLRGTLSWLKGSGILDEPDLLTWQKMADSRNRYAHELAQIALDPNELAPTLPEIALIHSFLRKFELRWWLEIEIAVNPTAPQLDDPEAFLAGSSLLLNLLEHLAVGNDEAFDEALSGFSSELASQRV